MKIEDFPKESKVIRNILEQVDHFSKFRATVLITGESGTGKEIIARAIHQRSYRSNKPFISFNCIGIAENLLEIKLFGLETESFSYSPPRKGRIELAAGGTLFLNEVAELPIPVQSRILSILREMPFERVGGNISLKPDIRLVAASNHDLEADVVTGKFRKDLFKRLNVLNIKIPPLRQRPEDIPLFINSFINKYSQESSGRKVEISSDALDFLTKYHFPGNLIELETIIERATIICRNNIITRECLQEQLDKSHSSLDNIVNMLNIDYFLKTKLPLLEVLEHIEEQMIRRALEASGQVQVRAAEMLGITKSLLQYKLKKYNLTT